MVLTCFVPLTLQILAETGDRLDVALPLFEQRRMPDIKALIRLMTFSYPYQ